MFDHAFDDVVKVFGMIDDDHALIDLAKGRVFRELSANGMQFERASLACRVSCT
jgi:hypothetical protein